MIGLLSAGVRVVLKHHCWGWFSLVNTPFAHTEPCLVFYLMKWSCGTWHKNSQSLLPPNLGHLLLIIHCQKYLGNPHYLVTLSITTILFCDEATAAFFFGGRKAASWALAKSLALVSALVAPPKTTNPPAIRSYPFSRLQGTPRSTHCTVARTQGAETDKLISILVASRGRKGTLYSHRSFHSEIPFLSTMKITFREFIYKQTAIINESLVAWYQVHLCSWNLSVRFF